VGSRTLVYSLLVHGLAAGALLFAAERKQERRATAVAVVGEKREKPKEKPKPPRPIVAPVEKRPAHSAPPKAVAPSPPSSQPAPEARSGPPPVETGLTLGDADGPGIDVGVPKRAPEVAPKALGPAGPAQKRGPREVKRPDAPAEEECHEEPTKPEPLARPEIEYTQAARAAGIEGRLVLRLTVGADGSVAKADVVSSVDAGLDAAAIATVEKWRFKPAMRCGKPMFGGVYTLARRFELGD
jgi:protein TonB